MTRPVGRRALLGGSLALAATQAACSSDPADTGVVAPPMATDPAPSDRSPSPARSSRLLVAYFSRPGENYHYGDRVDLEVGNTEVLVHLISQRLRELGVAHDVHRIEAADPYSDDYDDTVARNVREQDTDARPAIADPLASIRDYGVVVLASPIWNVRPPMIMHTFAESYDWAGRTVHPVTTHAMSGLGTAGREYADACTGAAIGEGLAVQGEEVQDDGPPAVADWLERITA